jgi:hypothetical protein
MYRNLLGGGVISVDFDATDELLIIYSAFVKYLREKGNKMKHQLCGGMDWINLDQDRDIWRALVKAVMNFRFHKM